MSSPGAAATSPSLDFNTLGACRDPFSPGVYPASTGHSSSSLPLVKAHFSTSFIQKCHRDSKYLSTVQQNFQETGNIQQGCCSVWQPPTPSPSHVATEFWKCSRSNCGTPWCISYLILNFKSHVWLVVTLMGSADPHDDGTYLLTLPPKCLLDISLSCLTGTHCSSHLINANYNLPVTQAQRPWSYPDSSFLSSPHPVC